MNRNPFALALALLLGTGISACGSAGGSLPAANGSLAPATAASSSLRAATPQSTSRATATPAGFDLDAGATTAVSSWQADTDFSSVGSTGIAKTTSAIDLSHVSNPAPQAIYQTQRYAAHLTYTIPNLSPNVGYGVRLHFVESYFNAPGKRIFDAKINTVQVLTNFDIFKSAGGQNIAVAESFASTADATGTLTITMDGSVNNPSIAAIEITAAATPSGTYYVSPTGSDANPGTAAAPYLTVQHAANVAVAGNTVIVQDGTYEGNNPSGCTSTCYVALLPTSGTAAKRITFKAQSPLGASLNGKNFGTGYCLGLDAGVAYVTIEGFDVTGCRYGGIMMNNPTNHDILISQNHVHNIAEVVDTSCSGSGNEGINSAAGTYNMTLDSNTVNDVGRLPGDGCGAYLAYTNDHLIYMHGYNQTITNNVLYHAHSGWAIQIASYNAPDGPGWLIANNTVGPSNNPVATGDFVVYIPTGAAPSGSIENNVTISPNGEFVNLYSAGSQWNLKNNLIGNASALYTGSGVITASGNLMNVNPDLVAPLTYNYNLAPGSPILASGLSVPGLLHNFNQAVRANPPSIGAF